MIVSNRLPVQIIKKGNEVQYKQSIGGLATGLRSIHGAKKMLWIGWCGIENERLNTGDYKKIQIELKNRHQCIPIFLSNEEIESFYNAFSNKTLWPLFHHFWRLEPSAEIAHQHHSRFGVKRDCHVGKPQKSAAMLNRSAKVHKRSVTPAAMAGVTRFRPLFPGFRGLQQKL